MPPAESPGLPPPQGIPPVAVERTLELPMRLLGRTVKRTRDALVALRPGQVLAVYTDDP